ncbi:Transmembrane anterior posterior transformation protein 1, partial [Xenotaenia resolanae]
LMIFGFFLCADAFLYIFTLLPLRVLLALLRLLTLPCCGFRARTCPYCKRSSGSRLLQPAQVCDMLKGLILVLCFSMMHYVDYSMMYHLIRGQSVIKLYIIYNMLEVPYTAYTEKQKTSCHVHTMLRFLVNGVAKMLQMKTH